MTATSAKVGYEVVCADFRKGVFRSREDAERWLKTVEDYGKCRNEHEIREVA